MAQPEILGCFHQLATESDYQVLLVDIGQNGKIHVTGSLLYTQQNIVDALDGTLQCRRCRMQRLILQFLPRIHRHDDQRCRKQYGNRQYDHHTQSYRQGLREELTKS